MGEDIILEVEKAGKNGGYKDVVVEINNINMAKFRMICPCAGCGYMHVFSGVCLYH
ncbi:MAG: hypothetical protein QS748_07425 [Candidatus Endonucleobacter bathymodioli]|uniref:Uncharacterized protein n=1 Tax=Candidatus Endonucleibacter bathymodioli TaxID=539814 RepID=A0AA90ST08_9GAMM|nr:hypothetical protein [Candidatus Endonucleobacter bathymodioli]